MNELFVYNNFAREAVEVVEAGDICALTGIANASIGDTICSREFVNPLPTIEVCAFACAPPQQPAVIKHAVCRLHKLQDVYIRHSAQRSAGIQQHC